MVTQTCCARMKENRSIRRKIILFETALDLIKCLTQNTCLRLLLTCALISELPSMYHAFVNIALLFPYTIFDFLSIYLSVYSRQIAFMLMQKFHILNAPAHVATQLTLLRHTHDCNHHLVLPLMQIV